MEIKNELIDELLRGYQKPEDIIGEKGLLKQLTKALLERAMNAEMSCHLGYDKHDPAGHNSGNSRNGANAKTVKGEFGEIVVQTPRDRNGHVRAADSEEASDTIRRFRRQDSIDVRARHEHAGDSGAPGRDVWGRGEPGTGVASDGSSR